MTLVCLGLLLYAAATPWIIKTSAYCKSAGKYLSDGELVAELLDQDRADIIDYVNRVRKRFEQDPTQTVTMLMNIGGREINWSRLFYWSPHAGDLPQFVRLFGVYRIFVNLAVETGTKRGLYIMWSRPFGPCRIAGPELSILHDKWPPVPWQSWTPVKDNWFGLDNPKEGQ